jgi:hypothetical protein
MNSEIYGKPTGTDYGVVFGKDMREFLERPSLTGIEKVDFEKFDSKPANDQGYQPLIMELTYTRQDNINTVESVNRFIKNNIPRYFADPRYSFVRNHLYFDQTLFENALVTELSDGKIQAQVPLYGIARHPTQLYESATSLLLFVFLFILWYQYKEQTPEGLLLGLFLIILFGLRFAHELFKENQVAFEDEMTLNMGQILSIPLIIAGIFILLRALKRGKEPKSDA